MLDLLSNSFFLSLATLLLTNAEFNYQLAFTKFILGKLREESRDSIISREVGHGAMTRHAMEPGAPLALEPGVRLCALGVIRIPMAPRAYN